MKHMDACEKKAGDGRILSGRRISGCGLLRHRRSRRGTVDSKRGRRMIRMDEWGWRERGRESAKERYYWRDGREEGRFGYTNKGRRKGGRPGDRAGLGKTQAFPSKFEFAWEKKGGEERWTQVGMEDIREHGQSLGKRENR
jgi:hypothetical protein